MDLQVHKGEFLSLLGPSGCGKTTSLRLMAGFEQPDEGEILIGGVNAVGIPPYRRDVNTVFQSYALFPHMSVLDNVAYGLKQRGVAKAERYAARPARRWSSCSSPGARSTARRCSPAASSSGWRSRGRSS